MDLSLYFICDSPIFKLSGGLLHHIYDGLNLPFRYIRGDGMEHLYVLIMRDIIDRSIPTKLNQFLLEAAHYYATCMSTLDYITTLFFCVDAN